MFLPSGMTLSGDCNYHCCISGRLPQSRAPEEAPCPVEEGCGNGKGFIWTGTGDAASTSVFPGVHALKGVDFQLYPGEVHALVGENGAGKSTLIKIISGVHDFDEGEYLFNGAPAHVQNPLDAINKGISVIYQELNLVPSLSVAENIFFGHLPSSKRGAGYLAGAVRQDQGSSEKGGTGHRSEDQGAVFERGAAAARGNRRALSHNACILVMDEPTSALSPTEVENLFGVIRQLRNAGVGIIYVSHKLEEIFEIADRITVLRDGSTLRRSPSASWMSSS